MLKLIKIHNKVHQKGSNKVTSNRRVNINPFSANVPLIYPLKTLGFLMFSGCIEKWVNIDFQRVIFTEMVSFEFGLSPPKKICCICFNESSLIKMIKSAFYFGNRTVADRTNMQAAPATFINVFMNIIFTNMPLVTTYLDYIMFKDQYKFHIIFVSQKK